MSTESRARAARPGVVRQPSQAPASRVAAPAQMFWVVLQGDAVDLVESPEAPDLTVMPGERRKKIVAAAADRATAETKLNEFAAMARGIVGKGEAY